MIDLREEHLIPLRDVPKELPLRPSGKRLHISAVYRWVLRGIRGIRLESVAVGGTTYTSAEAIQRFADGLRPEGAVVAAPLASATRRRRQIERATKRVAAVLGLPGAGETVPRSRGCSAEDSTK